jgi:hypothetical protein
VCYQLKFFFVVVMIYGRRMQKSLDGIMRVLRLWVVCLNACLNTNDYSEFRGRFWVEAEAVMQIASL